MTWLRLNCLKSCSYIVQGIGSQVKPIKCCILIFKKAFPLTSVACGDNGSPRINPTDSGDPLTFPGHREYGWIAIKFGAHVHVPLRMKCRNSDDPLHL